MGGTNQYVWAFCIPLQWRLHLFLVIWWYKKRDGTIILGFLNSERDGRVYWVDVPEEFFFVCLVLNHKGIINVPLPYPGGAVLLRWLCSKRLWCRCWPLQELLVTPWQLLLFFHRNNLERWNRHYSSRTQGALWCYQLSWCIYLGDLCPVQVYIWWFLMQMIGAMI